MGRMGRWLLLGAGVGLITAARMAARNRREIGFTDRVVLITGGSRGLGLLLARRFAREGAQVVLAARDVDELERARESLSSFRYPTITFPCDVTDRKQVDTMISQVTDLVGGIDILVNNAGAIEVGPMDTMTLDDYQEAMNIHFWASLYSSMAVLPAMRRHGGGRIVNISSIGGKISVPHLLPYSASKHALVGLSEGMRSELIKDNIYVTTVCPGLMRTGSHRHAQFKGKNRLEYTLFSISNALPFSSIDADRAADQIITASRYGDADLVISVPAQAAVLFHALFPGAFADLFGLYNRFLPGPGGIGEDKAKGMDSETSLSPSMLTSLADKAAEKNNEVM